MPSLHIIVTSTSQTVTLPSSVNAEHLHLKMVQVKLDQIADDNTLGMEISLPFLKHFWQANNSTNRPNIIVPLSTDTKCTTVYPDVVFVGENIGKSLQIELLNPADGSAWTDDDGGVGTASLISVHILFEYSVKSS